VTIEELEKLLEDNFEIDTQQDSIILIPKTDYAMSIIEPDLVVRRNIINGNANMGYYLLMKFLNNFYNYRVSEVWFAFETLYVKHNKKMEKP